MIERTKWTPGPWAGEWQGAEYIVRAVEGRRDFPSDDLVARITCDAMSAETDGNMEVMRLAPEMAEALRKIEALELPRGGNYRTALLAWAAEVGDIARAILAKLEGSDRCVPGTWPNGAIPVAITEAGREALVS